MIFSTILFWKVIHWRLIYVQGIFNSTLIFFSDEPITKNFRDKSQQSEVVKSQVYYYFIVNYFIVWKEELKFWDKAFFYDVIQQGVSIIVIDPTKEGKPVVGMRLSTLEKRG